MHPQDKTIVVIIALFLAFFLGKFAIARIYPEQINCNDYQLLTDKVVVKPGKVCVRHCKNIDCVSGKQGTCIESSVCLNPGCDFCQKKSPLAKEVKWEEARQNIKAMLDKYPATALDCIDAAYLAGLEASKASLIPELTKEIEEKIAEGNRSGDDGKNYKGLKEALVILNKYK